VDTWADVKPRCPNTCPVSQVGLELCAAIVAQDISNNSFNAGLDKDTEQFTTRSIRVTAAYA